MLLLAVALGACKNGDESSTTATAPAPEPEATAESAEMSNMDPSSPEAWAQAKRIAHEAAPGALTKVSDALPFAFAGDPPVVVHNGAIVRDRGAAAAASYLRDLGVVRGEGPKEASDVLFVLDALGAWPEVAGVEPGSHVGTGATGGIAELAPGLAFDGDEARFTLNYLGEPTVKDGGGRPPVQGHLGEAGSPDAPQPGSVNPNWKPTKTRKLWRCVLHIPASGDGRWEIAELNWSLADAL